MQITLVWPQFTHFFDVLFFNKIFHKRKIFNEEVLLRFFCKQPTKNINEINLSVRPSVHFRNISIIKRRFSAVYFVGISDVYRCSIIEWAALLDLSCRYISIN